MPASIMPSRYSAANDLNRSRTRLSSISDPYTPIKVLNQFSTDWKLRARVTKKDEPRQWRNAKGEGYLMNVEIIDKDGTQIQATFFGEEAAKRFGPMIKENKVYFFSNG